MRKKVSPEPMQLENVEASEEVNSICQTASFADISKIMGSKEALFESIMSLPGSADIVTPSLN